MKCSVCNENESKYKCKCGIRYCSVGCFKTHKETCGSSQPTAKPEESGTVPPSTTEQQPKEPLAVEKPVQPTTLTSRITDSNNLLSEEALRKIGTSDELVSTLQHPQLQKTILDILDKSQGISLDQALKNDPEFAQFVDKMLRTVGARDSSGVFVL